MKAAPDRFARIDASLGRSEVALRVAQALRERLDG
jgi:hypothetical protein